MNRRKTKVVADIIGPRIPDLYEITEDNMEKYSKIALLLFKPHRSRDNILQKFNSFTEAFNEFQSSEQYKKFAGWQSTFKYADVLCGEEKSSRNQS